MLINTIEIIGGALLVIAAIIAELISVKRTPSHLRGYYGAMFMVIALIAIIGGVGLTTVGILGLVA